MKQEQILIRTGSDLKEKLRKLAASCGLGISTYCRMILIASLKAVNGNKEAKKGAEDDAPDRVSPGLFVSTRRCNSKGRDAKI